MAEVEPAQLHGVAEQGRDGYLRTQFANAEHGRHRVGPQGIAHHQAIDGDGYAGEVLPHPHVDLPEGDVQPGGGQQVVQQFLVVGGQVAVEVPQRAGRGHEQQYEEDKQPAK